MNTNNTLSDQEMMNALCGFILGKKLQDYSEEEQKELITETLALTYGYLSEHMENNFDAKDVVRMKQMLTQGDSDLLNKFPETSKAFEQSLQTMIESLS